MSNLVILVYLFGMSVYVSAPILGPAIHELIREKYTGKVDQLDYL